MPTPSRLLPDASPIGEAERVLCLAGQSNRQRAPHTTRRAGRVSISICSFKSIERSKGIMKELATYNRAAGYRNKVFDLLNTEYFENTLTRPAITIQSTPRMYGHVSGKNPRACARIPVSNGFIHRYARRRAFGLNWDNVDMDRGIRTVRQQLPEIKAK